MSTNNFWNLVDKYKKKETEKLYGLNTSTPGITSTRGTTPETEKFWDSVDKFQSDSIAEMYSQIAPYSTVRIDDNDDIAPVKEDEGGLDFFQKSKVFNDGYDFGDVTKTILGTAGDLGFGVVKGVGKTLEGVADLLTYGVAGVADRLGADEYAEGVRERTKVNLIDQMTKPASDYLDKASVLGRTSDAVAEGIGQVGLVALTGGLGAAAGLGTVGTTALTTGLMGVSGMGSGMSEAYKGGATDEEALTYGAIAGTADALTELIFGGLGKAVKATGLSVGLTSADDMLAKKVSSLFTNQIAKNFAEFGIKAGAEGFEEVLAGVAQGIGKKLTYMDEEELSTILKDENLLEQFVVGAVTSGLYQSGGIPGTREGSLIEANKTGKDFITGLNQNEQKVIDKEYENRLAEAEKDGKLTGKEKSKLYDKVVEDMDKGYISTDTIEEVLGGESYTTYQDTVKSEDSLIEQEKTLTEESKKLEAMVWEKMTGEQQVRRDELRSKLPELRQKIADQKNNSQRDQLKSKLSEEVMGLAKGSRLMESYNEKGRRRQAFEADLSKYDAKQQAVIKKAVESGILNNTNRTHEFVDFIAKVSADKGVLFDFTNNARLKESGFAVDGKFVNGYVTKDGVTVNIQSAKSLNSVVGHEITHVLEGTEFYNELQSAVVEYAKTKGEYQSRYDAIAKLYENIEGANIDAELTADLVGDYLFTDSDFISKLSTEHRNVFQKIYDEVKYLLKTATAGSKEAQQLEKVKRAFEKAYRETKNTAKDSGVKYTLTEYSEQQKRNWSASKRIVIYDNPQQLSRFIQDSVDNKTLDKKLYFGAIPTDLATRIQTDTGVDVENYNLSLGSYEIRKILKDHGSEATEAPRGQRAVVADDFAHIVDIVLNPESVSLSEKTYMGKPAIVFTGDYNGRMNVVAVVSDKRLDLFVQTVYVNTKKGNLATPIGEQAPINTPEANNGTVSEVNVAQPGTDVKYTLSDSQGRQLTQEQAEYFKDSKVRDENGNLLVVYHGTPNGDFTEFKDGTYFTDNKEYADRYQNPGASSISSGKTATNPKTFEVYLDIKKPFDLSDPEARRVYIEDYIKSGNAMGINPYLSDAEYAKIETIDWTEGEDLREFLIENGYDYDGLVLDEGADGGYGDAVQSRGKSYVVFSPEQIKNVDNQSPTSDPDIRYSLSDPEIDTKYLDAVNRGDTEYAQLQVDKAARRAGYTTKAYHGTSADFFTFDKNRVGKGTDQYGAGFYFASDKEAAGHYGNRVINSALKLENPYVISSTNLLDAEIMLTEEEAYEVLKRHPKIYDPEESPLGDYYDSYWETGVEEWMIEDLAAQNTELGYLDSDLFRDYPNELHEAVRDVTGHDGVVVNLSNGEKFYIAWFDNQMKSTEPITYDDNGEVIPLSQRFNEESNDIRRSLSETGEKPKTYGDYNVYGEDVALEPDEDIAPIAENAALVEENDMIAAEEMFPDDTAALQEEYEQLVAQRDDILGAMNIFAAVGDTANAEKMVADLEAVETRIGEIEADESDRLSSISEADEPVTMDSTPEDVADNVPLTKTMVAELAKDVRSRLALPAKRVAEVRDLIARYSAEEFPSRAHLYAEIYDRFGTFTESYVDEDLKGVKALLRTYGIAVDDSIKRDIADYGQLMRSNFGKVRFSKDGLPVDVAYMEFQEVMPGLFPESIDVPSDQLLRIIEVANMETTVAQEQNIDSDTLVEVTDLIANSVTQFKQARKETLANKHGRESFQSLMEDADQYVPPVKPNTSAPTRVEMTASPEDIAPVFDTTSGQQALMPEPEPAAEAPKRLTRKELHENIVDDITTTFREQGYEFTDVLKNAKDLSTFATVDNTPQRVMEKALGYKEGQILADMTVNKVAQNETDAIRWLNSFTDKKEGLLAKISKQYGIKPGSKKSAAAQMYAEGFYVGENDAIIAYGDAELAADFPDATDQRNIKALARDPRIRMIYDETLTAINESRTRNAYPEIPRLDNYFLHFRAMEDTFSRLGLPFNPNDIRAKDLPTDLNGVTADLKPGQPYFASAMHRKGKRTSFDLLGGLEKYLTSAKNQIYHIDDIQTLRALRNYVAETYGQAHGLENLDTMSDEEAEQRIEEVYNSHLSTFAKFLNEEANVLAGKTSLIDRGLEGVIGRRGMTFLDTLNRQVGANMVGFNVSSSLTNFLAPVQAFAKTNKFDFVKAMAQTASNKIASVAGKGDNFVEESPVMIRRKGAERFYRTPWQKVADTGYVFMGMVDDLSTELIARTKYNELTRKGMDSQQAHIETDKWVSRLMGDRSLGQQPQLYNSKTLGLITKFQLEVRNQLDSQFYDTIQEAKVSSEQIENKLLRNAKTAAKVTSTFAQLAVLQHLFGKAFESVAGYNPAFDIIEALIKTMGWDDDEEDEDTVLDNIEQGFLELLGDLPYTSTLTGGRIPIASALPVTELIKGEDQYGNEKSRWDTLKEAAPYYFLPGGYGQIKKTKAGLEMFSEEHPVSGSYTDSGNLRFPVEDTTWNRVQAGLFGQWASENARDYFDNERKPMQEKQVEEFLATGMEIQDYWDYREGLSEHDTLEEKADYIAGLDLPVGTKNILVNNLTDRKESIDLANYDEYGGLEEMDFAMKYPDKYEVAEAVGGYQSYKKYQEDMKGMKLAEKADYIAGLNLSTQQKNLLINSETDRKEPIDLEGYENYSSFEEFEYAKKNPEKYALAKAVGGYDSYTVYSDVLGDIKSDKDEWGESINGSRKPKVYSYIYSLDIPEIEQHILFKSQYPSTDDHNYEIIDYLNERDDISYDEMVAILLELDFKVSSNGTIRW